MALTDTSEYWNDAKRRSVHMSEHFTHIPNSTCGHINVRTGNTDTSEYLSDIDCFACLKLIQANGNVYGLKEGVSRRQQSAIDIERHRVRFGKCECGGTMCERNNQKTGDKFLGCSRYPECKKTKRLNT